MPVMIDGSAEDAAFEWATLLVTSWFMRAEAMAIAGQMYLDEYLASGGSLHTTGDCNETVAAGGPTRCVIHRPSAHALTGARQILRRGGLIEDECEHGVGHPNPDSVDYFEWRNGDTTIGTHGCDGCCGPVVTEDNIEDSAAERFI